MREEAEKGGRLYLAVIGDLRRSRTAPRRNRLQRDLEGALQRLNQDLGPLLAASLVLTVGDEFQGLLARPASALPLLLGYDSWMAGTPTRFGLGWGALSTARKPIALGMDGPCFHRAREAITRGKTENRWATAAGFGEAEDRILNGIFGLIGAVREEWTTTQARTIALMRGSASQKEVARRRGVTASTVHKALSGALYAPMLEAEESLRLLLARFGEESCPPARG